MASTTKVGVFLSLALLLTVARAAQQTSPPSTAKTGTPEQQSADQEAAARTARMAAGDTSPEAMEVLAFEEKTEAAIVSGDVAYVASVLSPDFIFVHGDNWTHGNIPAGIDNKQSFLERVRDKRYLSRDLDSVKVKIQGNVATTWGHTVAQNRIASPDRRWFAAWFERVYVKQNGKWIYLSDFTVRGPFQGPDRNSVKDK